MLRPQSIEIWLTTKWAAICTIGRSKYKNTKLRKEKKKKSELEAQELYTSRLRINVGP